MNVELVHASPDAEKLIVKMARVSNPANQDNQATAPRLLRYMIKHQHWSPFEMASMCVKIETERDIAAQILRHRSFSFQEYSQRYAKAPMTIIPALRRQDETREKE
jgi:thymidylate synthase (FAD)